MQILCQAIWHLRSSACMSLRKHTIKNIQKFGQIQCPDIYSIDNPGDDGIESDVDEKKEEG